MSTNPVWRALRSHAILFTFGLAAPVAAAPPAPGIELSVTAVTLGEAGTASFGVRLTAQPAGNVVVAAGSSDNTAASVAPPSLTFTPANFASFQSVAIQGVADADSANESVAILLSSAGLSTQTVTASVVDDDVQAITLSGATVSLEESRSATFAVRLAVQPQANVTVTIASGDTAAATVSPSKLTFTPSSFATLQRVVVSGVADADLAVETVEITLSSAGLANRTVTATVSDDDVQAIDLSATAVTLGETASVSLGVRLAFQPQANVTVTVASSDSGAATVSPSTLVFTPATYGSFQQVAITGAADADVTNESVTITLSSPGLSGRAVTAIVTDDDF
jgi:hypothetical protein